MDTECVLGKYPKKCKMCGARFYASKEYVYQIPGQSRATKWFCSYHCKRQYEKEREPKKR